MVIIFYRVKRLTGGCHILKPKKPTIHEVAKLADVSIATVSNVFSGRKPVNDNLKSRVYQAASELNYQIDRAGSQLRSGRSSVIAVLVPHIMDTFFATIVSHIENLAFAKGYDVIVASSHDQPEMEKSRIKALLAWRPAGLIAIQCSQQCPPEIKELRSLLPMVLLDRVSVEASPVDTVTIDNVKAGKMVAEHLFEAGHENILVAASVLDYSPISERFTGVCETLKSLSDTEPTLLELGTNIEKGAELFTRWLDSNLLPTAVFALTNVTTLAVVTALTKRGLKVPDDISLVAFDDHAWMSVHGNGLTAIRQPVNGLANAAWLRLMTRIESEVLDDPIPTVLEAKLIKRNSVKQLAGSK